MTFSETPIFPGKVATTLTNIPGGSASSYTIFMADSVHGGIVSAIRLMTKTTTARVGLRLELKDNLAGTTVILGRLATTGTVQYTATELLTSDYAPVNDADPRLILKPGQWLQLTTENSEAGTLDVAVVAATFEYPN